MLKAVGTSLSHPESVWRTRPYHELTWNDVTEMNRQPLTGRGACIQV